MLALSLSSLVRGGIYLILDFPVAVPLFAFLFFPLVRDLLYYFSFPSTFSSSLCVVVERSLALFQQLFFVFPRVVIRNFPVGTVMTYLSRIFLVALPSYSPTLILTAQHFLKRCRQLRFSQLRFPFPCSGRPPSNLSAIQSFYHLF